MRAAQTLQLLLLAASVTRASAGFYFLIIFNENGSVNPLTFLIDGILPPGEGAARVPHPRQVRRLQRLLRRLLDRLLLRAVRDGADASPPRRHQ